MVIPLTVWRLLGRYGERDPRPEVHVDYFS